MINYKNFINTFKNTVGFIKTKHKSTSLLIPHDKIAKVNNLDIIRFVAAVMVIFSHSFPLTQANNNNEPFYILSHGQSTIGGIAVLIFFIISGYLITQSYENTNNIYVFLISRILRILPALVVVTLFSVFILGPLITSLSIHDYFNNRETYTYLKLMIIHHPPYFLPGVFNHNIYPKAVNGSIWTLQYEVLCYLIIGLIGVLKLLNKISIIFLFIILFIFRHFYPNNELAFYSYFLLSFLSGATLYIFRGYVPRSKMLVIFSFFVILYSTFHGIYFNYVFAVLGSYIIIYIAFMRNSNLSHFTKYGDFSYGIYIYAFPIQQTTTMLFHNHINPILEFIITLPVTFLFSTASWYLIEKQALKLKKLIIKRKLL